MPHERHAGDLGNCKLIRLIATISEASAEREHRHTGMPHTLLHMSCTLLPAKGGHKGNRRRGADPAHRSGRTLAEGWHANSPERAISLDPRGIVPRWSLSHRERGRGLAADTPCDLVRSRALTESPDHQFFGQKWCVFVLL